RGRRSEVSNSENFPAPNSELPRFPLTSFSLTLALCHCSLLFALCALLFAFAGDQPVAPTLRAPCSLLLFLLSFQLLDRLPHKREISHLVQGPFLITQS